jgi:hypothetical protein
MRAQPVGVLPDNPEAGEFYGPPQDVGWPLQWWSRPWFEWRDESGQALAGFAHLILRRERVT